jgi:hypothetical protein
VSSASPNQCARCSLALLCLGDYMPLTRCRNCQRLFVYSIDLHLIGYPYGDKRWPEDFCKDGLELYDGFASRLEAKNSCPRCQPIYWSWRWDGDTQRSRRSWRIIDCDLEPL